MRRFFVFFLLLALMAMALSSCAPLIEEGAVEERGQVCATFPPFYALTALLTDGIDGLQLSCLVQPQDGCLRDYALSDWDLYTLASADIIIAGGRGLESFESTLQSLGAAGPVVALTLYNTELYNQDDEAADDEENSHLDGANPHLYMATDGARYIVEGAALALAQLYPEYAEQLFANMDAADERLMALGEQMRSIAANAEGARAILMNEALVYTAQELGIEIAGQYDRESGQPLYENEVDDCLAQLADMDARVVLVERQAPPSLTEALMSAGYIVAKLDVLSTLRADMGAEGYFTAQQENARAIAAAFAQTEETH